ncbi:hypothetical protein [Vibrio sp. FF145]|uniref:hypothetical protein n=1 Tax=Vibrio sp. FF145 TaxID=3230013 RepID=UPI00352F85B8
MNNKAFSPVNNLVSAYGRKWNLPYLVLHDASTVVLGTSNPELLEPLNKRVASFGYAVISEFKAGYKEAKATFDKSVSNESNLDGLYPLEIASAHGVLFSCEDNQPMQGMKRDFTYYDPTNKDSTAMVLVLRDYYAEQELLSQNITCDFLITNYKQRYFETFNNSVLPISRIFDMTTHFESFHDVPVSNPEHGAPF